MGTVSYELDFVLVECQATHLTRTNSQTFVEQVQKWNSPWVEIFNTN